MGIPQLLEKGRHSRRLPCYSRLGLSYSSEMAVCALSWQSPGLFLAGLAVTTTEKPSLITQTLHRGLLDEVSGAFFSPVTVCVNFVVAFSILCS